MGSFDQLLVDVIKHFGIRETWLVMNGLEFVFAFGLGMVTMIFIASRIFQKVQHSDTLKKVAILKTVTDEGDTEFHVKEKSRTFLESLDTMLALIVLTLNPKKSIHLVTLKKVHKRFLYVVGILVLLLIFRGTLGYIILHVITHHIYAIGGSL